MININPCPFCEATGVHVDSSKILDNDLAYFVRCIHCKAHGPIVEVTKRVDKKRAFAVSIELWNYSHTLAERNARIRRGEVTP